MLSSCLVFWINLESSTSFDSCRRVATISLIFFIGVCINQLMVMIDLYTIHRNDIEYHVLSIIVEYLIVLI